MAFVSGRTTKLLVDQYDLSAFFQSTDVDASVAMLKTTAYGDTAERYIAGLKDGTLGLTGLYDGGASAADAILSAALQSAGGEIITAAPEGLAVGKRLRQLLSRLSNYKVSLPHDGVVGTSASLQSDGGIDAGVSLHDLAAETGTGNSTSVDNAAASTNGGVAHLHLTAVTAVGGDTLDVKVQHSTNDSTWVDLVTFAQLTTALTKERVVVAAGTTVNRYLRGLWTKGGAGSPSYTFHVGFSRR